MAQKIPPTRTMLCQLWGPDQAVGGIPTYDTIHLNFHNPVSVIKSIMVLLVYQHYGGGLTRPYPGGLANFRIRAWIDWEIVSREGDVPIDSRISGSGALTGAHWSRLVAFLVAG